MYYENMKIWMHMLLKEYWEKNPNRNGILKANSKPRDIASYTDGSNTWDQWRWGFTVYVCWLLNVPATCECISGMDLLRQFYMLPH